MTRSHFLFILLLSAWAATETQTMLIQAEDEHEMTSLLNDSVQSPRYVSCLTNRQKVLLGTGIAGTAVILGFLFAPAEHCYNVTNSNFELLIGSVYPCAQVVAHRCSRVLGY